MTEHRTVHTWLARRVKDVPDSLRVRLIDAVQKYAPAGVPPSVAFRAAADHVFQDALSSAESRSGATTLLTADALVTYACEALAEEDPASLAKLI